MSDNEMSPRESDWAMWGEGHDVDTGGLCNCGDHEGLGPSWHTHDCPAVAHAWKARARELHDQLWDVQEELDLDDQGPECNHPPRTGGACLTCALAHYQTLAEKRGRALFLRKRGPGVTR